MDKWISVEDALPPALEDVLILFEPGGYFRRRIVVGYWWGEPESSWGPAIARKFKVTHWMPMPKMPNKQGHGEDTSAACGRSPAPDGSADSGG